MMNATLDRAAGALDYFRSRALRMTMAFEPLRPLFCRRWLRLAFLFALATATSLATSLAFPLWVLLLGPLVYGVPHVFSSMRYFHYTFREGGPKEVDRGRAFFGIAALALLAVFAYRLVFTLDVFDVKMPQISEWKGSSYLELMAFGAMLLAAGLTYRVRLPRFALSGLLGAAFALVFVRHTVEVVGALVLIHNFVGFGYWILAARTRKERGVAIGALLVTAGITALIFAGALDAAILRLRPATLLDLGGMSVEATGQMILPGSENALLWMHATIAFAFGQALHYFVWLKAVPDQYHTHEVAASFKETLGSLREDFGKSAAALLIVGSFAAIGVWALLKFQLARLVYFAFASFHGYLEIAGLALVITSCWRRPSYIPAPRSR